MINKLKLQLAKRMFRDAYIKYNKFRLEQDCGEELLLYMSSTSTDLRKDMEERHQVLKKMDPACPHMEYKILKGDTWDG
jgi:hypothetical protein